MYENMYEKFSKRMRSRGLKAGRVTVYTGGSGGVPAPVEESYIRITQELNKYCRRVYRVPEIKNPTAEYLMEHEGKALAFFEMA